VARAFGLSATATAVTADTSGFRTQDANVMLRWRKTRGTTPAAPTPLTTATPRTTAPKPSAAAGATPERSFPTVKFDTSRLTTTVSADLRSNIAAVGDIEARHQEVIYEVALRAIMAGGDLALLSRELRIATDMAARRAGEVSPGLSSRKLLR
jgi:hypothetical protein